MEDISFKGRKNARINKNLKVRFRRSGTGEEPFFNARVIDVSRSGFFIRTGEMIPIGTELEVELFLEDEDKPLVLTAVICRSIKDPAGEITGIGVKIRKIGDREKQLYHDFINLLNHYGWFC